MKIKNITTYFIFSIILLHISTSHPGILTHSIVCDDMLHLHIVDLLQVVPDVVFGHFHRYLKLYDVGGLRVSGLDDLHEKVGQEHPQLGVPVPIERIPEK